MWIGALELQDLYLSSSFFYTMLILTVFFFAYSYYILQIIQDDKGSDCYVFRKWGRVGNEKIGGSKLEEMPKDDAIQEFKRLFLEKTGNPWEAWEQKQNFQKHPGRFFPLDIVCVLQFVMIVFNDFNPLIWFGLLVFL